MLFVVLQGRRTKSFNDANDTAKRNCLWNDRETAARLHVVLGSRPVFAKDVVARPRARRWTRWPRASLPVPLTNYLASLGNNSRRLVSRSLASSPPASLHLPQHARLLSRASNMDADTILLPDEVGRDLQYEEVGRCKDEARCNETTLRYMSHSVDLACKERTVSNCFVRLACR